MLGRIKSVLNTRRTLYTAKFEGFAQGKGKAGELSPAESFNCDCRKGVLQRGVGVQFYLDEKGETVPMSLACGARGIYPTELNAGVGKEDVKRYFMLGMDGGVYLLNTNAHNEVFKYAVGKDPQYCTIKEYRHMIYHLFAGADGMIRTVDSFNYYPITDTPVTDICVAGGRYLMAKESNMIMFSAPYDPHKLDGSVNEGGTLYMPAGLGEIRALVGEEGYAYIFLSARIFRLNAKARAGEMCLEKVEYAGGQICRRSPISTGKGIVFLALDGAYLLRGTKAEKICEELVIQPDYERSVCYAGLCEGLALIDFNVTNANGERVTQRIAIDPEEKNGFYTDSGVGNLGQNDLTAIGTVGYIYRYAREAQNTIYENAPHYKTEKLTFGREGIKKLKALRLKGNGQVTLRLHYGDKVREYPLTFVDGVAETRLIEQGRAFAFEFVLTARCEVRALEVDYLCGA